VGVMMDLHIRRAFSTNPPRPCGHHGGSICCSEAGGGGSCRGVARPCVRGMTPAEVAAPTRCWPTGRGMAVPSVGHRWKFAGDRSPACPRRWAGGASPALAESRLHELKGDRSSIHANAARWQEPPEPPTSACVSIATVATTFVDAVPCVSAVSWSRMGLTPVRAAHLTRGGSFIVGGGKRGDHGRERTPADGGCAAWEGVRAERRPRTRCPSL
jgi:hypothetical protein